MTHPCPVKGCGAQIPRRMLMCKDHWRRAPRLVRVEVAAAYKEFKRRGPKELKAVRRLAQAQRDCVEAVESMRPRAGARA